MGGWRTLSVVIFMSGMERQRINIINNADQNSAPGWSPFGELTFVSLTRAASPTVCLGWHEYPANHP